MQVFSAEWFAQHQDRLLKFANTRYGRRVLKIHGSSSAVGTRRITRIEPHAITWDNGDGTVSTEFRTHDKYAKRLYHAFKPLWYGVHTWDTVVANNLARRLNLGFDSLTVYPEAGDGTFTVDGIVARFPDNGETFAGITSRIGTTSESGGTDLLAQLVAGSALNTYDELFRFIMTFNTSSIPAGSLVSAASLSLYVYDKFSGLGATPVHIVSANPNQTNRLSSADYQRLGSTSFANVSDDGSLNFDTYYSFTLNSSGIANVNPGGITSYGGRLGWDLAGSFTGSWSSFHETYYDFGAADSSGTSSDPKLVVTYTGTKTSAISGTLLLGGGVTTATVTHNMSGIGGTLLLGVVINVGKDVAPVAGKEWIYRVYDQNNAYLGIWPDVDSSPDWEQQLNTPGTTTTVHLARSANATTEKRDTLQTDDGIALITDAGDQLAVKFVTNQTVGPDTDVFENHNVDIYVHYGGFDTLETDDGQTITTDTGEELLIAFGAPLGRRVFSGFILDYDAAYGDKDGVDVTLMSHGGWELANTAIHSGTATTVSYSTQDHGTIIQSLMAMNSGKMGAVGTVATTGSTISPTYQLNTLLEGINDVFGSSPAGWYWYGNIADNNVYFQQAHATADHTFVFGQHIGSINVKKTIVNLANDIRFAGGDTGGGVYLYEKFTTSSSVNRTGLNRPTDSRVKTTSQAQAYATKYFARYKNPIYASTVVIPSEVYDIESIELGDTVTFANFGNFIDSLLLVVTDLHYAGYTVELQVGEILPTQAQIIAGINTELDRSIYQTIPASPDATVVV